jgi:hypothetical protein
LDDAFRLLAIVNIDAGHVDSDIARSNNNAMIIEGLFGLILSISAGGDKHPTGKQDHPKGKE